MRYGLRVDAADTNAMYMATRSAGFGDEVKRRIMLGTYALSAGYYDAYYGKALKVRRLIAQDFDRAYERFDLLLAPTSPSVAFPFGTGDDGLPVGVQLLAPALGEVTMLRAAAVLEASAPPSASSLAAEEAPR